MTIIDSKTNTFRKRKTAILVPTAAINIIVQICILRLNRKEKQMLWIGYYYSWWNPIIIHQKFYERNMNIPTTKLNSILKQWNHIHSSFAHVFLFSIQFVLKHVGRGPGGHKVTCYMIDWQKNICYNCFKTCVTHSLLQTHETHLRIV